MRRQTPITYRVHSTTSVLYGLYLFTEFGSEPASVGLRRLAELREDFHRIVYAASAEAGRAAYGAFDRKWAKRSPGVVRSLQESGAELLTFFTFPKAQRKTLRTTNVIERLTSTTAC